MFSAFFIAYENMVSLTIIVNSIILVKCEKKTQRIKKIKKKLFLYLKTEKLLFVLTRNHIYYDCS